MNSIQIQSTHDYENVEFQLKRTNHDDVQNLNWIKLMLTFFERKMNH